ncbi:MAG: hypothetical protein WCO56_08600 [Verrucomicrobiota bacterium]
MQRLFIIFVCCLIVPRTWAATKDEYRAATVNGMRETVSFGRAKSTTKKVLTSTKDGKIAVIGRGEIMLISQLLLAGRPTNDAELLGLARDLVLACNKAALDGYDTPQLNSLEQIGFSLRELALAVPQLKELKLLTERDGQRADETLKKAADFLPRYMPKPGDGNIAQRYALGLATVCTMFPGDPRVPQWRAWAAIPFLHLLHFPDAEGLPGSKRRVLEKQGTRWKFVEDTKAFEKIQTVDISEDSSAYQASTIVSWMGIARLIGREAEIKTPTVEAFIDRFYQQLMPIGILPAYGDAEWNGSPALWISIFEWAGTTFRQPKYRAAADAIFRYHQERGLVIGDLSEAVEYADETLKPEPTPRSTGVPAGVPRTPGVSPASRSSVLLQRVSGRGERIPDKVVLRGSEANDSATQPYVMMQATESLGHSHPHAGSISAYCAGGAVLLHTLGYDATATPLHQSFILRPPDEPFLNFFGDPKGTLLGKIMPDGQRLTSKIISDDREVRSAAVRDSQNVAYGRVVCDYLTAWQPKKTFNGHAFLHTRELALDKQSGLLCVFDTVESKDDFEAAFGPVWHIQHVLAKNAQGFLCQTDFQSRQDGKTDATKPRPVWIAMAGPAGTQLNSVFWKFTARHGHSELPQERHLTAEWRGKVTVGQKVAFLTVFVPLPEGTTAPPNDLKFSVEAGHASITRGAFTYAFPNEK